MFSANEPTQSQVSRFVFRWNEMFRNLFKLSKLESRRRHQNSSDSLISSCRGIFSKGEHLAALGKLEAELATPGSSGKIVAEVVRTYFALGAWSSALLVLTNRKAAGTQDDGSIGCLLSIQEAFINIFVNGDLTGALHLASSIWNEKAPALDGEETDEIWVRSCYYCLEIYDVWKRHGEGYVDPEINPTAENLQSLIFELTKLGLYFEAQELLEFFLDSPEHSIKTFIAALPTEAKVQKTDCWHRLARIQAKDRNLQSCKSSLARADKGVLRKNQVAKIAQDCIELRYLNTNEVFDRMRELVRLSEVVSGQRNFLCAMQILEEAAELHCQLPAISEVFQFGIRIHDLLSSLCHKSGDYLSLTQFEFRRYDMINSLSDNFSEARRLRDELLSSPLVANLPYFQRFHRRQWAECFLLHQREEALSHAIKYLEYCRKYRDEAEQSLADNLYIETMLITDRRSEEAREALLKDVYFQLEQGIRNDRAAERHLSQVEKLLMFTEVLLELGDLQEEAREETLESAVQVLDEAGTLCSKIGFTAENSFLKFETTYLRSSLSLGADALGDMDILTAVEESSRTNFQIPDQPFELDEFRLGEFMHRLALAIQNDSIQMLRQLMDASKDKAKSIKSKCHPLKWARFLIFQGFIHYMLAVSKGAAAYTILQEADIKTPSMSKRKSLEYLEEASTVQDAYLKETPKRDQKVGSLMAYQAYLTGALDTFSFQLALTICYEMEDNDRTWIWTQRWKARAFSKSFSSTLRGKYQPTAHDLIPDLPFEDMLWVSSASTRNIVFVDWVPYGLFSERLMLLTLRFEKDSDKPLRRVSMAELETSTDYIGEAKRRLSPARLDDDDAQRILEPFRAAIDPLAEFSREGDILVLAPTGPLHNVPLHAVSLGDVPLIQRNPVCYTSSLSALVTCLRRTEAGSAGAQSSALWKAEVFGAYEDGSTNPQVSGERHEIYSTLGALAERLETKPTVGVDLTKQAFQTQAEGADLLHFHGHGRYDEHDGTSQSLELGPPGESLALTDIATVKLNKAHVTLIACHGGVQDVLRGDEPLGLQSVFLLAGATSVLGALWPVQSATGREFTQIFYDYFLDHVDRTELGPIVNLAMATRHASLRLRDSPETRTPYHWASFALYGSWFCRRKPGTW